MQDAVDSLSPSETLAFAGLLRKIIREDGRFTDAEREALARVALRVAEVDAPTSTEGEPAYRGAAAAAKAIGETRLYALIDEAAETFADDDALRAAALAVQRPEARAAMHALLFDVATSGASPSGDTPLLDWLAERWGIDLTNDEGEP